MGRFHYHADGTGHAHDDGGAKDHHHPDGVGHGHGEDEHGDHDTRPGHDEHLSTSGGVGDHSGYETGPLRVEVLERILGENDRTADANRADFAASGVRVINLMSSPGAGKTTLLRETLLRLAGAVRIGIIEGDIETALDAERLAGLGAPVSLVNTANGFGGECHLDATMVRSALGRLPLAELDVIVVENVGNLVCPAEFDIGQDVRAMVFSVTEGEDKPLKYPVMFRSVDVVVVNKVDLLPHLDMDMALFEANLRKVNPGVTVIELSAKTGQGLDTWCNWLTSI